MSNALGLNLAASADSERRNRLSRALDTPSAKGEYRPINRLAAALDTPSARPQQTQLADAAPRRKGTPYVADFEALIRAEGAEEIAPVVRAIYKQESGGGTNARTSIDGARGGMQVMPATFRQYAKPGERIDNPEDNVKVGIRIALDLRRRFGNDAAKIATGYFSGPGNVNPGAGTAWKHDRADGNGKRVSSYAADIVARVKRDGGPVPTAAQSAPPAATPSAAQAGDGAKRPANAVLALSQLPTWKEIKSDPKFQQASPEKQARIRQKYFDDYVAPAVLRAGENVGDLREGFLAQGRPQKRTWGEAVSDTSKQLVEGTLNLLGTPAKLVAPHGAAAHFFDSAAKGWRDSQSEIIKQKQAEADERIRKAGEEGQRLDGAMGNIANQFGEVIETSIKDPALGARVIATNVPSMLLSGAAGKLTQLGLMQQGMNATRAAQIATTATGAINAISNAGDARGDAFEDIKNTLVQQGVAPDVAEEIALKQSLPSAAIGGLAGYLGGKTGLESAVMTKEAAKQGAGSIARQALKAGAQSAASEMLGELPEEVLPKVATNLMAAQHDGRSVAQDVGRTMAETMIGVGPGAVLAGGAGARNEYVAQRAAQTQTAPGAAPLAQTPAAAPVPEATPAVAAPALEQATAAPDTVPTPVNPQPHPTVQAADAVVRELALENGVPLETVLPQSAIDPVKEARAAELSMRAMDGAIAATEQAELAALQQEMAAQPEIPQPTGESEHGAETAQAQPTAAQGTEWQQAPQDEQLAPPKTEREAMARRRQTHIITPDGQKVQAQWDVVEADSVQASLKEGVSQPRDRTRAASDAQVRGIVANPDFERLSDTSKTMDYGAPTLSPDGLIVGGNGRFEGVSQAYDANTASAYRAELERNAWRFGIDGNEVRAMQKPVLVRRVTDSADTRQLAIQSNQPAGLQMSDMEQAALDAERMQGLERIAVSDTGDIPLTANNRLAIQHALGSYSTNEVAGMVGADGSLSQSGLRRVRNAILYRAYGKSETLARLIESPDADMKNVGTALVRAAGALAQMQDGVADGSIPAEFDIAADLTVAIETLSGLRAEGMNLSEFLAQADMFGGELTAAQKTIIRMLADNLRSAKNITAFLHDYAQQVMSLQDSENGLLGQMPIPSKEEVLDRARQQHTAQSRDNATPELHARATGGDREVQAGEGHRPDGHRQSGDEDAREAGTGTGAGESRADGGQEDVESAPLFNRSETTQQAYEQRIDALFAGAKPSLEGVRVLDRGDVLSLLGYEDKPVVLAEGKVKAGVVNHPLITAEVWKKVPEWLENPAAVFDSETAEGLVFIAPETIAGRPVSIIVRPDAGHPNTLHAHVLLNTYERSANTPFLRWMNNGLLRFVDQKKFPTVFESTSERRLPGTALQNKPGTGEILTEKNLAGWRRENVPQFNRVAEADDDIRFQRAWHGTPHRGIEKTGFQLNKIGTGEGAQAYGWGMYFASQKEVAEHYQRALSLDMREIRSRASDYDGLSDEEAIRSLRNSAKHFRFTGDRRLADEYEAVASWIDAGRPAEFAGGQLYSVEVPEDSDLLNFDAPLNKQPEKVRQAIEAIGRSLPDEMGWMWDGVALDTQGKALYGLMGEIAAELDPDGVENVQQAASKLLLEHGIPGLRYLDGDSRSAGNGTHNYVIWDEALLTPEAAEITPMYSRSETTKAAYEQRIDELFAGEKPRSQGVRVLDRSDMLGLLGMGDGPVHVVESKVEQGRYNHGLTATDWKKVPEWLDNPAAVFDSDTQPGRLMFIAPELVRGSPVRMIIDPRPDGKGVNLLINAYDAERNPFARWINDGLLRYVDTKKTTSGAKSFQSRLTGLPDNRGRGNFADVLSRAGLQLPRKEMQNKPGMPKILTEKNLAGWRKDQSLLSNRRSNTTGAPHDNRIIRDNSPDTQRAVGLLNRYFESRGGDAYSFQGVRTEGIDSVVPLAQAFGAKVVGIQIREGLTTRQLSAVERFNGARYQGYIYLNATTNRPHLAVLGHEMAHEMRAKRPDLYDRMIEAITPYIKHKEYEHWAFNDVVAKDVEDLDKKQEEFIGEVLSDGFMEPEFWRALGKKNKQLLVQVQNFLARMLQKIAATVGYTRKTEAYLTDYERVMQIAGEVMGEYGLDQGKFHRMAGIDLAPLRNNPTYSRSAGTQQAYEQRIDELFAGAKPNRIGARILDRSDVLGLLGHADKPVLIAESKVVQGQVNHPKITAEVWKKIPQWLDAPAAVFESDTDGGLVFLAPETIHGSPVSLIVLPDKDGRNSLGVHLLLNAYDRSRSTPFGRWVRDGLLKYVDQKKFPALFESVAGRRLPGTALQNKPGTGKILTEKNLAGWRRENVPQFNRAEGQGKAGKDKTPPQQWTLATPGRLAKWWDKLIYDFQDKHINLKRVQEAIAKVKDIAEHHDVYQKEELFHGRVATRVEKFLDREIKPLIQDMALKGVDMPTLEAFLWARHAKERNAQIARVNPEMPDGGSGLTDAQVDQYLAGQDVKGDDDQVIVPGLKAEQRHVLEKLAGRVDDMIRGTEEVLIQYGLETRETIDKWRETYAHYVPLHREDMDGGTPIGMGFSVKGSASKRATGSSRKVVDILAHVALQREAAITRGEKNRVGLALYGLALENPQADFWAVDKVPQVRYIGRKPGYIFSQDSATADFWQVEKDAAIEAHNRKIGQVITAPDRHYMSRSNVFTVRIAGVDRAIVFNERNERAMQMVESLKNLDAEQLEWMLQGVSRATRYLAAVSTQYNLIFGLRNGKRDWQAMMLNLSSTELRGNAWATGADVLPAARAIWQIEHGKRSGTVYDQLYDDLKMNGGTTGYREIFRMGNERGQAIQKQLDSLDANMAMRGARATLEELDRYNTTIENATRLAVYKKAIDLGYSKDKAASIAKNITTNFNRKGKKTTGLNALYAFFNAAIQGNARTIQTWRGPGGLLRFAGMASVGALQVLIAAIGFDEEEWEDIPEFEKQRSLLIPIGDKGVGKWILPQGHSVPVSLGRIATEAALGQRKSWWDTFADVFTLFLDAANPLGSATPLQTAAPSVLDPVVAIEENKTFSGRAIAKEDAPGQRKTPGFTRARDTSSHLSRGLAWGLNRASGGTDFTPGKFSPTPDQLDYLFGSLTGGLGREVNRAYQFGELLLRGEDIPANKVPVLSSFYGTTQNDMTVASRYWRNVEELSMLDGEAKGRAGRGDDITDFVDENPQIYVIRPANKMERQISKMRRERHRVEFETGMPEAERTERLKELDANIVQAMKDYNEMVAKARKRKLE